MINKRIKIKKYVFESLAMYELGDWATFKIEAFFMRDLDKKPYFTFNFTILGLTVDFSLYFCDEEFV